MSIPPFVRRVFFLLSLIVVTQEVNAAYPDRPIRFIVPAAAGGAADATIRIVAAALARRMGQPIIIENRPGAAGAIGLDTIAKAPADGYTIGTANLSNFTVASNIAKRLPYSPSRDFSPIAMLTTQPYLLGVAVNLPVKSVKELVAYGRLKPLFYGSSGNGSALHILTELFRANVGLSATHVPYKSVVTAESDLMAGEIQMLIDNFSTMAPNVGSGRVRALAVTGLRRSPLLPDIPTMAEVGVAGVDAVTWSGVVGPARMSADVVNKLNAEINFVLADPGVRKQLADIASDPTPMTVSEFSQFIKAQDANWRAVIQSRKITGD